jgi:hypothetical protein
VRVKDFVGCGRMEDRGMEENTNYMNGFEFYGEDFYEAYPFMFLKKILKFIVPSKF